MIGIKDQCFGVEIELTGITRAEAAEALAAYFETTPQRSYDNYDSWYVPDREGKQWRIMSDGSIRAEWNDDGHYRRTTDPEYRVEMVTPKLTYDEMEKFQECVRRVRQAGGKVNDSCGMHVHVDASNHNRQSLKNLLSIMYSKEDLLFKALKRTQPVSTAGVSVCANPCCSGQGGCPTNQRPILPSWRTSGTKAAFLRMSITTGLAITR